MRARPSAEIRAVEVQKLRTFYDFCGARHSAEIRVVEVQKLRAFYDFCGACATLCGDSRGRGSKAEDFFRFLQAARDPLRGSCVSKRSRCGAVRICCSRNGLWKLSRGSRACFRNPAVAGSIPPWSAAAPAGKSQLLSTDVVCGACSRSSGWKIATFKYRRSMRSVLPQLRLENRNF